jgi:hypothetical protein
VSSPNQSSLEDEVGDHLCAKLHLVDLAGSERAKRTKADGQRLQEGRTDCKVVGLVESLLL